MPVKTYYVQTALSNFHSTGLTLRLPAQNTGQDTGHRAVESHGGGEAAHFQVLHFSEETLPMLASGGGANVFISFAVF